MNTTKIKSLLVSGKHEKAFVKLYQLYPKVEKFICINSGSKQEALDIFQDGLMLTYKKVNSKDVDPEIKIDGFLINSCKLLWSNELRKKKIRQKTDELTLPQLIYQDQIQEQIEKEKKMVIIDQIIEKIGEKCKKILEMFYFKNFSMEKIAKRFDYKTVQSAKTKKYKCMEHARNLAVEFKQEVTNL